MAKTKKIGGVIMLSREEYKEMKKNKKLGGWIEDDEQEV